MIMKIIWVIIAWIAFGLFVDLFLCAEEMRRKEFNENFFKELFANKIYKSIFWLVLVLGPLSIFLVIAAEINSRHKPRKAVYMLTRLLWKIGNIGTK